MSEAKLAAKLKEKNPQILWKAISDKFGVGTPDRCIKFKGDSNAVWWVELKFLKKTPLRSCKVGLKPKQASWLEEWSNWNGNSAVIIGFGDQKGIHIVFNDFKKLCHVGLEKSEIEIIDHNLVYKKFKEVARG